MCTTILIVGVYLDRAGVVGKLHNKFGKRNKLSPYYKRKMLLNHGVDRRQQPTDDRTSQGATDQGGPALDEVATLQPQNIYSTPATTTTL